MNQRRSCDSWQCVVYSGVLSVLFNLLCVWISFQNTSSQSCFKFLSSPSETGHTSDWPGRTGAMHQQKYWSPLSLAWYQLPPFPFIQTDTVPFDFTKSVWLHLHPCHWVPLNRFPYKTLSPRWLQGVKLLSVDVKRSALGSIYCL